MKIEEYGNSVLKKACELIKNKQVILEWPLTNEQMLAEQNQWRFMVLYGKDNGKENGYYVDKDGHYGNLVYYLMRKGVWTCTCMHYRLNVGNPNEENCKHICAAKIRMDKLLKDAKKSINKKEGNHGSQKR